MRFPGWDLADLVARMAAFLSDGDDLAALRPAIGRTFDLQDVVRAHERFESGASTGKIVVTP